jgi:hypothetical protein
MPPWFSSIKVFLIMVKLSGRPKFDALKIDKERNGKSLTCFRHRFGPR